MKLRSGHAAVAVAASLLLSVGCTGDDEPMSDEVSEGDADEVVNGADEPEEAPLSLVTSGMLTVCTEGSYPPFEYTDEDSPSGYGGFDIELLAEVAQRLDLDGLEIVETSFEEIVSGAAFEDGRCDVGASAISITPGRADRLTFTEPYYVSRRALLVPAGSTLGGLEDLERGMVLGVQSGTAAADRAATDADDVEVRTFEDSEELYLALVDGELDAVLHDHAVVEVWAEQNDDLEVTEQFRRIDEFAFAVQRDRDDELVAHLDRELGSLRADGTYDDLFERFFGVNG